MLLFYWSDNLAEVNQKVRQVAGVTTPAKQKATIDVPFDFQKGTELTQLLFSLMGEENVENAKLTKQLFQLPIKLNTWYSRLAGSSDGKMKKTKFLGKLVSFLARLLTGEVEDVDMDEVKDTLEKMPVEETTYPLYHLNSVEKGLLQIVGIIHILKALPQNMPPPKKVT